MPDNMGSFGPNGIPGALAPPQGSAISTGVNTININKYGADPTGNIFSDAAFAAAYSAALLSLATFGGGFSGAMIEFGQGVYKFNVGQFKILNAFVGARGQGVGATVFHIIGSSGDGVYMQNTAGVTSQSAAPFTGITIYGWDAGTNVNGLHYGDRYASRLDVEVVGFNAAGSRNILMRNDTNTAAGCERTKATITTAAGGVSCITFDGNNANGTFDYADWDISAVSGSPNQTHSMFEIINQAHVVGGRVTLRGNTAQGTAPTANIMKIGSSVSDRAIISGSELNVCVEVDGGNVNDFNVSAASFAGGIQTCSALINIFNAGGTAVAGPWAGSYQAQMAGMMSCPSVATYGQLSQISPAFAAWDFSNTQKSLIRTDVGSFQPGGSGGPGARLWSGTGAPTGSSPTSTPANGDFYLRMDTPGTANQRLYVFITNVWTGIL